MIKSLKPNQKFVLLLVVLLRTGFAFLILTKPLLGILISNILDCLDYGFYLFANIRVDKDTVLYNRIDKSLDHFYYTSIFIYFLQNSSGILLIVITTLFVIRTIGFILFQITADKKYFLYFPNIFENFSIAVLLFPSLPIYMLLLIAVVTKLPQEIYLHYPEKPSMKRLKKKINQMQWVIINVIRKTLNLKQIPVNNEGVSHEQTQDQIP